MVLSVEMAGSRSDLFKWKRQTQTKPTNHARSNVQDWVKRVERASRDAAQEVFGSNYHSVLEQVHIDDDAMIEAQDLLDSWVQEKKMDNFKLELEFQDESWANSASARPPRGHAPCEESQSPHLSLPTSESIHVTGNSYDHSCLSPPLNYQPVKPGSQYEEDLDEEIAVQQILRGMLDKKVVETNILSDLGFEDRKRKDPRPKMELRHQQVKEKSAARRKEREKSQRDRASRKEAENMARQQLMKEEKERRMQIKREEQAIQKEMAKLRRAMEDEKRMKKEHAEREKQEQAKAECLARHQLELEMHCRAEEQRQEQENKEEMRRMLLQQMEERAAQETSNNLRVLQKYFSAWWSVVVNQRVKFGKARALADWRCKLRAWSAWKAYVWHIRSDKEAQAIAWEMKEKHRKEQLACTLYTHRVLGRCFGAWRKFVQQQQEQRQLEAEHRVKTNKMAALLQAAASGRLWSKHGGSMELQLQDVEPDELDKPAGQAPDSRTSTARELDEMFSQPARKPQPLQTPPSSHRTSSGNDRYQGNVKKPPKAAWTKELHPTPHRNAPIRTESGNDRPRHPKRVGRSGAQGTPPHRQRTHSQVEQIQTLFWPDEVKSGETRKNNRKELSRSRSEDVLDRDAARMVPPNRAESHTNLPPNRAESHTNLPPDSDVCPETDRSSASCKLLSREPLVKSQRPTTKTVRLAMEERARERLARKELMDQKRRRAEEEKLARLKLEQERKEAELLAEKQELLKKKREEKRLQRERELEKQQRLEQVREMNSRADQHYARTLLQTRGVLPWRRLVAMTQENMGVAVKHHNIGLLEGCFYPWLEHTRRANQEREIAAGQLANKILLKRSWRQWRKYGQHFVRLHEVASDYCASYLVRKYFRYWQNYVTEEELLYWEKERRAEEHDTWRLKTLAMTYWKKFVPMLKDERQREARRQELRKRVQSWLPDFQGSTAESP